MDQAQTVDVIGEELFGSNTEIPTASLLRTLWVVVPCHNETESLPLLLQALDRQRDQESNRVDLQLLLVDDGSTDRTLDAMRQAAQDHPWVHYVALSRNFGKEAALYAGLDSALNHGADLVAVMDADLQDPPELLSTMLDEVLNGDADVAAARRVDRKGEPPVRSFFANMFYRLMAKAGDVPIPDGARDYRVMCRMVAEAIVSMPERTRFSKGIFAWVGFPTTWVEYEHVDRTAGTSSWSFWGLVRYALEGVVSFSTAPLTAISILGLVVFLLAMIILIFILVRAALFGDPVAGWPSLAALIVAFAGLQILCLGVLGLYLAHVYAETKGRPIYLIKEDSENHMNQMSNFNNGDQQ